MALKKIESSSRTKKIMFLPIKNGIEEALSELKELQWNMMLCDDYFGHF